MEAGAVRVRLDQCAKTFPDGTKALAPLDLEVHAGETVVFLGPSGCGKTTMLRMIAGLEAPDEPGRVFFGDEDVTVQPIERRNVGMVFQSYALFPNMTVAENVAYGLKVRKLDGTARDTRVGEMLAMMHLDELGHRRVDQLSGGQKQRVALARALAVRPRVLLLDEPLTALDAKLREGLRVEIDRLLRSLEITSIYVTHDQAEAMALGDRIAVMEKGRIAQIGTPQEIYYRPQTAFVADFVGTMNRLAGRADGATLEVPGGRLPWTGPARERQELLFRPEDVSIVDGAGVHLRGTVVSAFFLGDHTRLIVDTGAAQPLVVETAERRTFRQGESLALAVNPEALLALERSGKAMLIGQISDLHIKANGKLSYRVVDTAGMLARCVDHVLALKQRPDVLLVTGDLVDFGRPEEYATLKALLAPLPMPYYLIPGNHDERGALRAAFPEHGYLRQWDPFVQYAIEDWPVRIVALDTVIPGKSGGELCGDRLAWLEATLAAQPGKPTIVIMHHPPFHTGIGHMDRMGLADASGLAAVISRNPQVERVLCGHLHRPIQVRFAGTIASTCPSPAHQVALDLDREAPSRFVMEPPAYQLHQWSEATGVVSHTAFIGEFAGPYPFYEGGKLID